MKYMFYIKLCPADNCLIAAGLEFRTFMDAIPVKPSNMLLLSSAFYEAKWDRDIRMEYVDENILPRLYDDDVYNYGDFCWVDYENDACRAALTGQEIAELLYLDRFGKPLGGAFFPSLKNRYFYMTHDDGHWLKIYMRDMDDARAIVEHKLVSELKGRKRSISPIPSDIYRQIHEACLRGVVFDFEGASCSGVHFYVVDDVGNMDELHEGLDRLRSKNNVPGGWIEYSSRKKSWWIY